MRLDRVAAFVVGLVACGSDPAPQPKPFTQADPGFYQELSWSPDGKTLLVSVLEFIDTEPQFAYRIWQLDTEGRATAFPLTGGPRDYWSAWSPDGRHIAFTAPGDSTGLDVYVMNADGTDRRRLTTATGDDTQPSWSPDGTRIAYISHHGNVATLWTMAADGSGAAPLTTPDAEMQNPVWSPDGKSLTYYETDGQGNDQVHVIGVDGTGRRAVVPGLWPTWTPDGTALVYAAHGGLYRIPVEGGSPQLLMTGRVIAGELSADGQRLAAIVRDSANVSVVVRPAAGGDSLVLMQRPGPPW